MSMFKVPPVLTVEVGFGVVGGAVVGVVTGGIDVTGVVAEVVVVVVTGDEVVDEVVDGVVVALLHPTRTKEMISKMARGRNTFFMFLPPNIFNIQL
jgi:hypothetical protein